MCAKDGSSHVRGMITTGTDRRRINRKTQVEIKLQGEMVWSKAEVAAPEEKRNFETMLKKAKSLMVENPSNSQ